MNARTAFILFLRVDTRSRRRPNNKGRQTNGGI